MPIGFIGGSGIYDALALQDVERRTIRTPFGDPSAPVTLGRLGDTEIAFLPRHGPAHTESPATIPYRANMHAFKQLGCERVLSSNAVGSLREALSPGTLCIPDQLFDRTRHRVSSFYEDIVVHIGMAEPYCPQLVDHLDASAASGTEADHQRGGSYVCIEGPQFSTRVESEFYRDQGFDIVGMTAVPEAKLAREAELCYATIAGVTDYDVWRDGEEVSQAAVVETARANEAAIKAVVETAAQAMPTTRSCDCGQALEGAVATDTDAIPAATRDRYGALLGDRLPR